MSGPKVYTLGCRLNGAESEIARAQAEAVGLEDVIIVNTCAVTTESVRQAAQTIRRLKRENPAARIVATGCAAELEPERFATMAEVEAVLSNAEKTSQQAYARLADKHDRLATIAEQAPRAIAARAMWRGPEAGGRTRAIVPVQNGCDHRCTFCIIPFARGPSRSVPADRVVEEIRDLVADGAREVVLTGVDLTSYGTDIEPRATLGDLVQRVLAEVPRLARLRLSSIDNAEADPALLEALAGDERLMPHLHLSLQSGDDLILKRMKRRHTRASAIAFCERVRALRPEIVFGADLIAGFPTESDEMFASSLTILEACDITYVHVFPYSARPGTPAARMPAVASSIVKARAERLRTLATERTSAFYDRHKGSVFEVLMEKNGIGRTAQFAEVRVENAPPAGTIGRVRVDGHEGGRMLGHWLPSAETAYQGLRPKAEIEVVAL